LGNDFVSRPRLSGAHFSTRARRARTHERVSEKAATAVMHAQSLDAHHAQETGVVSREPVARAVGTRRAAEAEAEAEAEARGARRRWRCRRGEMDVLVSERDRISDVYEAPHK